MDPKIASAMSKEVSCFRVHVIGHCPTCLDQTETQSDAAKLAEMFQEAKGHLTRTESHSRPAIMSRIVSGDRSDTLKGNPGIGRSS